MSSHPSLFNCQYSKSCFECCLETEMALSEEDLKRIGKLGYKKESFVRNIDGFMILKNVDKHCYFLKEGKCSIYENRPLGCKFYPLIIDFEINSIIIDESCPKHSHFDVEQYSYLFNDLLSFIDLLLTEKENREK